MKLPVYACQKRLATIWMLGFVMLTLFLAVQTVRNVYGTQTARAWSWYVPTVVPTLSLILGAIVQEARKAQENITVDAFAYHVSAGFSIGYLFLILGTLLIQPLTAWSSLELMNMSNFWLAPVQGFVGISLGAFFISREAPK